jgi:hypothetical protein
MEKKFEPKWNPADKYGKEFSEYRSDRNKLHKKSLLPLDQKPLQEKEFRRTGRAGSEFSYVTGSIM